MSMDMNWMSVNDAIHALSKRKISPQELVDACRRQITILNPDINAFISIAPDKPVEAIRKPLSIPVVVKDLIDTAGMPTTGGSPYFFGETPSKDDAYAVKKLRDAGAIFLGKTNTHEIALGVTGVNPHFGAVHNPYDFLRICGGSSSGSAAAVATGMCLAALGTDTGGSIRIPASLCGVVGLKPTYGRVSKCGVIPLSWNLDHVGPITRTVKDAAILLAFIAGYDPGDPASSDKPVNNYLSKIDQPIKDWRVLFAEGEYFENIDPGIHEGMKKTIRILKGLGAQVEFGNLDWISTLAIANGKITQADAAEFHRQRLMTHPDWFGWDVRQRLEAGRDLPIGEYIQARLVQSDGRRRMESMFSIYDLIVLPTTPITAPPIEGTGAVEAARRLTRFTAPFNLIGFPALSLPGGITGGLPYGIQLVSQPWTEEKLLRAGNAFEKELNLDIKPKIINNQ